MSNNDLISREALKKEMDRPFWEKWEWEYICKAIDNAPVVDLWQLRQEATENALKKAEVLYGRPQGELAEKLKDRIEGSVCKYCQMNRHCELCEISRVFQIISLTMQGQEGGAE